MSCKLILPIINIKITKSQFSQWVISGLDSCHYAFSSNLNALPELDREGFLLDSSNTWAIRTRLTIWYYETFWFLKNQCTEKQLFMSFITKRHWLHRLTQVLLTWLSGEVSFTVYGPTTWSNKPKTYLIPSMPTKMSLILFAVIYSTKSEGIEGIF